MEIGLQRQFRERHMIVQRGRHCALRLIQATCWSRSVSVCEKAPRFLAESSIGATTFWIGATPTEGTCCRRATQSGMKRRNGEPMLNQKLQFATEIHRAPGSVFVNTGSIRLKAQRTTVCFCGTRRPVRSG